ncbi:DMT family transporter [Hamadaea sp. NPDC051192]|uniref:DMT family transporter n=1 Tax=Hamadaea sp. NPDC051192 TaxID=3154940 RepID=UPI00342D13B4
MYAIALAAACALIWGASDFCGGKASQRAHPLSVTVLSQILGLPMIALMMVVIPGTPRGADLLWGAAAGVLGLFGIVLLYRGLSQGAMAVVAPTTAVTSAIVPILGGLLQGERPAPAALAGAFCAVAAIGLVSLAPSRPGEPAKVSVATVGLALLAGACFGGFFIILGFADADAGLWPMLGVRASSLAVGLLLVWRAGARLRLDGRTTVALAAAAGLGDTLANGFYLLAVQRGDLSVIAPIAALYPASTVLLALLVEKERMRPLQFAGLGLAALALVLTAT